MTVVWKPTAYLEFREGRLWQRWDRRYDSGFLAEIEWRMVPAQEDEPCEGKGCG